MRAVGRQPFDRRDRGAAAFDTGVMADADGAAVDVHGARAALADAAAELGALQFSTSRSTHSSGMSPGTSTVVVFPLTFRCERHSVNSLERKDESDRKATSPY